MDKKTPFRDLKKKDMCKAYKNEMNRILAGETHKANLTDFTKEERTQFYIGFVEGCNHLATIYNLDIKG